MKTNILNAVLSVLFIATGIVAFFLSERFFNAIGDYYGTFNLHFVKDAGISYFSSGTLLLMALRNKAWRVPLTIGGAMFIVLHGLLHVQMLIMGMVPTAAGIGNEIAMVIVPAALTGVLAILRLQESKQPAG